MRRATHLIDGGNSYYRDDLTRNEKLAPRGIHYVDVGTSGGVFGLERGYCMMIGGDDEAVGRLDPIFKSLAPGIGDVERTPGRTGEPDTAEQGYLHTGPAGAGHFVKMVHNGIEYGLMAAYAEGLNILHHATFGKSTQVHDAETAPVADAERNYAYDLNIGEIAEVWRRGSVVVLVSPWTLTAAALAQSPELSEFASTASPTQVRALDRGRGQSMRACFGARHHRVPVRPLRLSRPGRVRQQAALSDAQGVRRPLGEAGMS